MTGTKILAFWKRNCGQEAPAEAIALCIALGFALGVCPVVGCPTILCTLAAILLRVNLPAIQFVNYFVSPLQLTLMIPFVRLGAWLFRGDPGSTAIQHAYAWRAFDVITAGLHAMVAWFCVCAPAGLLVYVVLLFVLRRHRAHPAAEETKRLCTTLP
jgi:uncharacterized protein (DUF2062 family)